MMLVRTLISFFFFFNDTATTEIYTLSLHDALPISRPGGTCGRRRIWWTRSCDSIPTACGTGRSRRSEEHTSELQSRLHLVCRLLLEKKKKKIRTELIHDTDHEDKETCVGGCDRKQD